MLFLQNLFIHEFSLATVLRKNKSNIQNSKVISYFFCFELQCIRFSIRLSARMTSEYFFRDINTQRAFIFYWNEAEKMLDKSFWDVSGMHYKQSAQNSREGHNEFKKEYDDNY